MQHIIHIIIMIGYMDNRHFLYSVKTITICFFNQLTFNLIFIIKIGSYLFLKIVSHLLVQPQTAAGLIGSEVGMSFRPKKVE